MSATFINAWDDIEGVRRARDLFVDTFGCEPDKVACAPGRVNLIGEHTDYNDGLCLPIALPHRTFVALREREDSQLRLTSDQGSLWEGAITDIRPGMETSWVNYAAGPAWALGVSHGFDAAFVSCVPLGAGLSSSAAIECAAAVGLSNADGKKIVAACIRAENEVAQAPTGGMDQTVSVFGEAGMAVFIDFYAHSQQLVAADFGTHGLQILVVDTRAKHSLSDGQYGNRRAECNEARDLLGVSSLRVARMDQLSVLPELYQRRVRHVISENERVERAVVAMAAEDFVELGRLFTESHVSLRDDFEVSCVELDCVVESALAAGALGARMTGGGFGGSAIALIAEDKVTQAMEEIRAASVAHGFPEPAFLVATASSGARVL